jgi:hypothetical protein
MAENKTKPTGSSVTQYLEQVENDRKREDSFKIMKIMEEVTGEDPVMWGSSIVGFGSYHYKYESGREGDMPLTGFAPRKQNLTLYIMDGFDEYDDLLSRLGKYKTGKSCLYIKNLEDVDPSVLRELVAKSVDHMKKTNP